MSCSAICPRWTTTRSSSWYRVAQESVTNAIRHARAGCIAIALTADGKRVELTVRDDGVGIADGGDGGGRIRSMRERALSVGGRLVVARRTDGPGTEVRLVISSER